MEIAARFGRIGSVRTLIVDDHAGFRATARRMLECEGFDVVGEAATGAEALTASRRLAPELILLDVQLPDTDGVSIASKLANTADGPAVLLISSRPRDDLGPLDDSGARGFIPKDELTAAAIRELLS
jgi:DNA-binding NarL/FixJ family response regulator